MTPLERLAKHKALLRLWKQAVGEIEIEHPDPNVWVDLSVTNDTFIYPSVNVNMDMWGLIDTSNRDRLISPRIGSCHPSFQPFTMILRASCWPGYRIAQLAVLGAWTTYMQHECFELVKRKHDGKTIVNPHEAHCDEADYHRQLATIIIQGQGNLVDLEKAIRYVVGYPMSSDIIAEDETRAMIELEVEMREAIDPTPQWT